MPQNDKTGPKGNGPRTGRGLGTCGKQTDNNGNFGQRNGSGNGRGNGSGRRNQNQNGQGRNRN